MAICWYLAGTTCTWQYSGHIVKGSNRWIRSKLGGIIGALLHEAREFRTVSAFLLKTSCSVLGMSYHVGTMSI